MDSREAAAKLPFEGKLLAYALGGAAPGALVACLFLARSGLETKNALTLGALVVLTSIGFAFALRDHVARALRTVENVVGAVREGDYSFRARRPHGDDALASAMRELNLLGATLREQRLEAMEATALLDKVMQSIDVAVFAFDADARVKLVNPAGARLRADDMRALLEGDAPRTINWHGGRYELRRATFRLRGLPHQLVVLADLRRALREEERLAWQRLVRVLGHEINNSLAPIHSLATQMQGLVKERPDDWQEDVSSGLAVIARRAEALQRFLSAYAKLARLPRPQLAPVDVGSWVRRVAALESRVPVEVKAGPDATILADGDQLDQLLINLVRNAADAALETSGAVKVTWTLDDALEVRVTDEGPGISDSENLFVPFFTTKPSGSGIGLVLSRQIAEAHGGSVSLEPAEPRGCLARVRLPSTPRG